jgi:hypothetical protein
MRGLGVRRRIVGMTPEDLNTVHRSWSELRRRRAALRAALVRRFRAAGGSRIAPAIRANWLLDAVDELVGLLPAPSRLATRARDVGETWPDPLRAPSFAIEGRVWLGAAADCLPGWTKETDAAWRQAWLLLSDVLAVEALSPFTDDPASPDEGRRAPSSP